MYNAEPFLEDTLDSVLIQTFTDFEYLLLDDGSTDRSREIIQSYTDLRIKHVHCPHNFIKTQNRGFDRATGKYIAQLDHDDIKVPRRLEIQYGFMEQHPGLASCAGYMQAFGKKTFVWKNPLKHTEIVIDMLLKTPIHNTTAIYRREFMDTYRIRLREGYSFTSDLKIFSEIVRIGGHWENIPQVLTWHTHDGKRRRHARKMGRAMRTINREMAQYLFSCLKSKEEIDIKTR